MRHRIIFIAFLLLTLSGCDRAQSDTANNSYGVPETEQGNPYGEGTGHGAGYKWAEETGGDCNGSSQSFNEGCEEYYQQQRQ